MTRLIAFIATLLLGAAASAHVPRASVDASFGLDAIEQTAGIESAAAELHFLETACTSKTAHRAHARLDASESACASVLTHCGVLEKWSSAEKWASAKRVDSYPNEQPTAGLPVFVFNLRFPGQQYDRETGTHYNYFRDYEPGTGRYVQSDPVGLLGGNATFSYASSSPLFFADLFGLKAKSKGCCGKDFLTYFADDLDNPGKVYVGRTSGESGESSNEILNRRKAGHHRNLGPLTLDKRSCDRGAIRGREQMMMDKMRDLGKNTDQIRGISLKNKKINKYLKAAKKLFGMP